MNNNRLHTIGIIGLIALMILTSCSNEDQYLFSNDENTPTPDILLQERSNGIPTAIKLPMKAKQGVKTRGINSDGELIGNSDILLGYSYSVGPLWEAWRMLSSQFLIWKRLRVSILLRLLGNN